MVRLVDWWMRMVCCRGKMVEELPIQRKMRPLATLGGRVAR